MLPRNPHHSNCSQHMLQLRGSDHHQHALQRSGQTYSCTTDKAATKYLVATQPLPVSWVHAFWPILTWAHACDLSMSPLHQCIYASFASKLHNPSRCVRSIVKGWMNSSPGVAISLYKLSLLTDLLLMELIAWEWWSSQFVMLELARSDVLNYIAFLNQQSNYCILILTCKFWWNWFSNQWCKN